MRVFLTGATGYIGTVVAERLAAAGHQLSALARSDSAAARLSLAGVRPVPGDLGDPLVIARALVLDQQASGRRAEELLGWRPHQAGPIEELERGSYATRS